MTASNFLACFNETESFEGAYADAAHDPGGATMAGVTQAAYTSWLAKHGRPNALVKGISLADREAIYREDYWNAVRGDDLYAGLDLVMVDTGWGSGPAEAIKLLQRALGITADGEFGAKTLAALEPHENSTDLINKLCVERMAFFRGLSTWQYFGKGWTTRLDGIQAKALAMNKAALAGTATPSRPVQRQTILNPAMPAALPPAAAVAPVQPSLTARLAVVKDALAAKNPQPVHESLLARLEAIVKEWV